MSRTVRGAMSVPHHALVELGARWSSALVLAEAELALHRWAPDVEALRPFGWGPTRRARFEVLVDKLRQRHDAWNGGQHDSARPPPGDAVTAGRRWLDRAVSILEAASLDAPALEVALGQIPAAGSGAGTLREAIRAALARSLSAQEHLDPDAADPAFFDEGAALLGALDAVDGSDPTDPSTRAEVLDALDGEVFLTVRALNRAAWRAFGEASPARAARYVMQFLVTIGRGEAEAPAAEPPPAE